MIKPAWLKNKVLILGLGREGQVTLKFLLQHWPELEISAADQRNWEQFSPEEQTVLEAVPAERRFLGKDYLSGLEEFEIIFKTPGENRRKPQIAAAINQGVVVTSATSLFYTLKKGRVIAVTGSKGKSTTASMIYQVLKKAGRKAELIGNIGKAALDFLEKDTPDTVYVFEMSSYQLEDYQGGADIAVIVSFFPDHLDYHGDLDSYFQAKMKLAAQPKEGFKLIYNQAQERLHQYFSGYAEAFRDLVKVIPFNDRVHSKVEEENGLLAVRDQGTTVVREDQIKLKGRHNLENILAVTKVAREMDIDYPVIAKALAEFSPLEHRLELVGTFKGITFYNDAISTTPESTMAAINALSREKPVGTLIAGGLDRGYQFEQLAAKIIEAKITNLILLPDTGARIEKAVQELMEAGKGGKMNFYHCGNMPDCVEKAYEVTEAGNICLMSCASPSYNLFKNFEEKGKIFKETVRKLAI
jgi:UDP-N-acetylmuramoylalanine--D-glutamate ligase